MKTAWGRRHRQRLALVDGADVLASATHASWQRSSINGRCACAESARSFPSLRCPRAGPRELVDRLLEQAARDGAAMALLFSDMSREHQLAGFDAAPVTEVEISVAEPSRRGAPMTLIRGGERDLAAIVAMGRIRADPFRFHLDRDVDLVRCAITTKRMLAGLGTAGAEPRPVRTRRARHDRETLRQQVRFGQPTLLTIGSGVAGPRTASDRDPLAEERAIAPGVLGGPHPGARHYNREARAQGGSVAARCERVRVDGTREARIEPTGSIRGMAAPTTSRWISRRLSRKFMSHQVRRGGWLTEEGRTWPTACALARPAVLRGWRPDKSSAVASASAGPPGALLNQRWLCAYSLRSIARILLEDMNGPAARHGVGSGRGRTPSTRLRRAGVRFLPARPGDRQQEGTVLESLDVVRRPLIERKQVACAQVECAPRCVQSDSARQHLDRDTPLGGVFGNAHCGPEHGQCDADVVELHQRPGVPASGPRGLTVKPIDLRREVEFELLVIGGACGRLRAASVRTSSDMAILQCSSTLAAVTEPNGVPRTRRHGRWDFVLRLRSPTERRRCRWPRPTGELAGSTRTTKTCKAWRH